MTKQLHTNKRTIKLKCSKCKRVINITTTHPEIYTPEIKQNWTCISCSK